MNKFVKAAISAAMVMGAMSSAHAGMNTGKVTFYGTIEESPCSVKVGDEDQRVNMGHVGTGSLKGNLTTTPVDFYIHLQDCNFTTEKDMSTVFNGITHSTKTDNLALMGTMGEMSGASLAIGDRLGKAVKIGDAITYPIVMNSATSKGMPTQDLQFKAWLVGEDAATPVDLGDFTSVANYQITYL